MQSWADANLTRFSYEWRRYFRGELPVKDDSALTAADIKNHNLILFGDPGSNSLLAKVLPKLPMTWTEKELVFGGNTYAANNHAPVMVQPNPLAPRPVPRAEQRSHVSREGTRLAQLSAVPAPR